MSEGQGDLLDVLAVGAHPDDVELNCGGLLLRLRGAGYRFGILDLTAGERGSRGDAETRAREAKEAAAVLGASTRECLGLPDTKLEPTSGAVRLFVEHLRRWQPRLVIGMDAGDLHPDHRACAEIVRRGVFLAALQNFEADGEPHRVRRSIRTSRHNFFRPSFVVDITDVVEKKLEAARCFRSQFTRDVTGPKTPISAPDFEEDLRAAWRFWGQSAGALYAEPYAMDGLPVMEDPVAALCRERRDF